MKIIIMSMVINMLLIFSLVGLGYYVYLKEQSMQREIDVALTSELEYSNYATAAQNETFRVIQLSKNLEHQYNLMQERCQYTEIRF